MAWIEQTGQHTWRVRYPHADGHSRYGSVSGFATAKAARDYAGDLESDQRLIPTNPVHRRRRRSRRRDHSPTRAEKVFAMPEHVIRIAEQAAILGGPSAGSD